MPRRKTSSSQPVLFNPPAESVPERARVASSRMTLSAQVIWSLARERLKQELSDAAFASWVLPATAAGWGNTPTPTLQLMAPSSAVRDQLAGPLRTRLELALSAVAGQTLDIQVTTPDQDGDPALFAGQPDLAPERTRSGRKRGSARADRRMTARNQNSLIAVDADYANRRAEIHRPTLRQEDRRIDVIGEGHWVVLKQGVQLEGELGEMLPTDALTDADALTAAILRLVARIEGPVAERCMHLFYEVADRNGRVPFLENLDVNTLLDRLGYSRDERGYHTSSSRRTVRDVIYALSTIAVAAERTEWGPDDGPDGKRRLFQSPLIIFHGGEYSGRETKGIPTAKLLEHGLPEKISLTLGWYQGVRHPDGTLGSNYVLMPPLPLPEELDKGRNAGAADRLVQWLYTRYRMNRDSNGDVSVIANTAYKVAGITTPNTTWARRTLTHALDRLVEQGSILAYSPVPSRRTGSFVVTLNASRIPSEESRRGKRRR
jgi:hypothetical protein